MMIALLCASAVSLDATRPASADDSLTHKIQVALQDWLTARAGPEKVTGIAAYISFGDPGPAVETFAGKVGRDRGDPPVNQGTLFQMGSTAKSFAAAVILKLEAEGKLSINDKLGKFLPQYPAWKDVSLKRLLNMTSGIPNYSETEAMSRFWTGGGTRELPAEELVSFVYPKGVGELPPTRGYHYSNTNYILAGLVAAKVAGVSYRDLVQRRIIDAQGLGSTFYETGAYPAPVVARLAHGYFDNPACADYQPNCERPWTAGMMGRDVRALNTSWAQAAGGALADARDVDRWMRAVFSGRVVPPRQQAEWMALVSTKTGKPIADVSAADPGGFSLGLGRAFMGSAGAHWFYQGETLGYRTLYVWFAQDDIMITVQTNSQPAEDANKLRDAVGALYSLIRGR